ncbi:MAG: arylsulfatase [Oligoflexus sp.]
MMQKWKNQMVLLAVTGLVTTTHAEQQTQQLAKGEAEQRPNVVIFMLDDAGFGQFGAFGGPIETPNIDRVADMGLRYTNYHTTALCSPTRAALLTGRNHHSVGTGVISELQTDYPGYTSRIPKEKFSLVETLRQSGYTTGAFGKWHNTPVDEIKPDGPYDLWPTGLGFERFYGFLAGDASQWEPLVWDNTSPKTPHVGQTEYHFTTDMTNQAIEWLNSQNVEDSSKPFFLYFAPGAVHAPHHAPAAYIKKYQGRFDQGWDKVREETLARQKNIGIVPQDTQLAPRPEVIKAWDQLSADEKRLYARFQETFAGFLEHTDAQFGRLLDAIETAGKLENTIIIVTSDNGASGEAGPEGSFNEARFFNGLAEDFQLNLAKIEEIGSKTTYNNYPAGWALAGNTPLQYFKQTTNEGGTRVPFIIAWPNKIDPKVMMRRQFTHVIDVLPTILDLIDVSPLEEVNGINQEPIEGTSFARTLSEPDTAIGKTVQYFEMLGNRAIWQDGWKAVAFHGRMPWDTSFSDPNFDDDEWNLYKIDEDISETVDLSEQYPEKLAELKVLFDEEAQKYNVYPLDDSTTKRVKETYQSFTAGIVSFRYTQEDGHIHEALSPPVKNKSHTITAKVVIPKGGADGVIVAVGGRVGGYSLFMDNGILYYTHNWVGTERYQIASSEVLPNGQIDIRFEFDKTGEHQGFGRLYVDDRLVGQGQISKTTPNIYSQYDTFDIGEDSGSPVSDRYESPFPFIGTIESVEVMLR